MNFNRIKYLPFIALALCSCVEMDELSDADGNPVICPGFNVLSEPVAPPKEASAPLSSISKEATAGNNKFALDFYVASSSAGDGNVCVSPFSVGNVLAMIANGDDGASRDEILSLFGLKSGEEGTAELNSYYQTLLSNLPNLDETQCFFTNSLWCDPQIPIRPDFEKTVSSYFYNVKLGISPQGEMGREAINQFVRTNTYRLIDNFLKDPIDSSVAFLNTSYFKGCWTYTFPEEFTKEKDFLNIDNTTSSVPFMKTLAACEYAKSENGTEALRLPIGKDVDNFSMTFILPSAGINYQACEEVMTEALLNEIDDNFAEELMSVSIPRFESLTDNFNAMEILSGMGLKKTCDPDSGFPLIVDYPQPFYLNTFIHACKIIVNENGTEGAAASMGGILISPGDNDKPQWREIVFDRPFVFLIRENSTGTILFIGSVKKLP